LNCTAIFFFPFNPHSAAWCQVSGPRFCVEPSGVSGSGRLKPDVFDLSLETLTLRQTLFKATINQWKGGMHKKHFREKESKKSN
jgi:hypothetical protein